VIAAELAENGGETVGRNYLLAAVCAAAALCSSLPAHAQTTYVLTLDEAGTGTGTVTSSPAGINCTGANCTASYASGTIVVLGATAAKGSTFTGWSGACTGTYACFVKMSAAETVTATFSGGGTTNYALTLTESGTGTGTVTSAPAGVSCPGTCTANFASGTAVTLTAAATGGSTFAGWGGACTGTGTCTVTMSAAEAVTASFTAAATNSYALSLTEAGTGSGTVTSAPAGLSCPGTCTSNFATGTVVTLTATPATGSTFAGWGGACTGTGTCSVTMNAAEAVTASFTSTAAGNVLTVTEAGTGVGTVTSSPAGINCTAATCTASYASGTIVVLGATAAKGSTFTGWTGACTGVNACFVKMSAAESVTATFGGGTTTNYALTVSESGTGTGTVTSTPTGVSCPGTCTANYASGTVVTLTATATGGGTFAGWGGACTGTGTCTVAMGQAQAVTASFTAAAVTNYALTLTEAGAGTGVVTSSPAGINCAGANCSANFASGTVVTLTESPSPGNNFTGWSGACTGTGTTCTVTMSAAEAVTATFGVSAVNWVLTEANTGSGSGTVTSSPAGISCPGTCSASFANNTNVTMTATPAAGSSFTGWGGACTGTGPCVISMTQAWNLGATFTASTSYALTLTEAGTGSGTVTSTPSGISCPGTCSGSFTGGTVVTLTATPASGSTFTGWSGACTGTAACSVTLSQAQAVTATFTKAVSGTVSVALHPAWAPLTLTQSQQFTATVTGSANTAVNWTVDGIAGGSSTVGTVSATGFYTPPATAGTHTITATSQADTTKSASATIAVTDLAGVFTYHNDIGRTGQNLQEYALTPANVKTSFGKLFSCSVDASVYAQPLYVANLAIGGGTHNVVFVATENDSVYAFDADGATDPNTGNCLAYWTRNFLSAGVTAIPSGDTQGGEDLPGTMGITGTPVIGGSTIYLVARFKNTANTSYFAQLRALNISTGADIANSPVTITASVPGTAQGTSTVTFNPLQESQRPALLLVDGNVYLAFGSAGDGDPFSGWLLAYNANTLAQTAVFNSTPNGGYFSRGAFWMGGGGPASDGTYIYIATANGVFDNTSNSVPAVSPKNDLGDTLLKFNSNLVLQDFFTPAAQASEAADDYDFGSGGVTILPAAMGSAAHPNLVVATGKPGNFYLVDTNNMGHYITGAGGTDANVQTASAGGESFATTAVWKNTLYIGTLLLSGYTVNNASISAATMHTPDYLDATPSISAAGDVNGIAWAINWSANGASGSNGNFGPAVLKAYDATNLSSRLYTSDALTADKAANAVKFTVPTIANGKVYIGGATGTAAGQTGALTVYGLKP
jgi:hypothetical protein